MENEFYSNSPARLIWEKAFGDEYPEEEKQEGPAQENENRTDPSLMKNTKNRIKAKEGEQG